MHAFINGHETLLLFRIFQTLSCKKPCDNNSLTYENPNLEIEKNRNLSRDRNEMTAKWPKYCPVSVRLT